MAQPVARAGWRRCFALSLALRLFARIVCLISRSSSPGAPSSMGPGHFQRAVMRTVDQAAQAIRDAEIEDFLEGFNQPTHLPRHAGQWGSGRHLVIQARVRGQPDRCGVAPITSRSRCYPPQNASMAFCSAPTLENPSAAAAALSPPNCLTSAATLWPKQFACPGVPANLGAGWMKTPRAIGVRPTGIVAVTALLAVSITDTVSSRPFTT